MTVVTLTGTVTVNAAFLQEIKEVNQELWSLLSELRHRCQRPVAPGQCRLLIDKHCQLRDQLALHFSLEEAYGYFEDPVDVAPQLGRKAEELRGEHKGLYLDLCDLIERAERMFDEGVVDEVRRALGQPLSRTVEKALGLREIASLEPDEALERIVSRTRRYARYQRKWMQRIPGIVLLDGERDPETIAAEVVAHAGRSHVASATIV